MPTTTTTTTAAAAAAARPAAEPPVVRLLARRWAHKGKVHLHVLVEQLGVVGAVDGGARFLEGRVLD
jgi:hypothetical protein